MPISDLNFKKISNHSWKSKKENKNSHPLSPTRKLVISTKSKYMRRS